MISTAANMLEPAATRPLLTEFVLRADTIVFRRHAIRSFYWSALRTRLCIRVLKHVELLLFQKQTCPELSTSFLNQITFNWFTGLAVKGYRKPLERDDLWGLNERDSASNLIPQFNQYFKPELQKCQDEGRKKHGSVDTKRHQPSVLMALFKTYKFSFISGALLKLIFDLLQFVAPALLKQLISFIQDRSQPMWVGITIASFIFIVAVFQSMILHQYFHLMFRLGMNIRSVLTSAVYSKASALEFVSHFSAVTLLFCMKTV
ncbi:hypothetical protein ANCDUO_01227 [Ancylostoma duodenale]|uniref:ABC transmembrane type-1 domain-containing protein n=1 Tax=Ancylostoma duodenale TaxID=51022 RepID=A0A0C2DZI1_9BILA|nr:hypothetical protein ANCDUO_01227 [Ancylostoma duodenale]